MAEKTEASLSSGSDVIRDFMCELCKEDDINVEAHGYCQDCREYLCGSCYSVHRRTRASRNHVLVDKDGMQMGRRPSSDRVNKDITTKCKAHGAKLVKYYCRSHDVFGCSTCFVTGHRSCSGIDSVVDASENILESQYLKEFISHLQSIERTSCAIVARARENTTISGKCCSQVVSSVRGLKEEVIEMLNEIEQNLVTFAEKIRTEDSEKMESVVADSEAMSENIEQVSSELESLQSSKRVCQLFIRMKETEGEVKTLRENLAKTAVVNVVREFTFEPNADFTSLLRRPDIIGKVSLGHEHQQIIETSPTTATVTPLRNMTLSRVAEITVQSDIDIGLSGSSIRWSAVVSAQRLIIIDIDNCKVKLVDTNTQRLLSDLRLPSEPWDVTLINRNQAAVTLPNSSKILLLGVADTLWSQREINVRGKCCGVDYSQDRLLVTYVDNPRLEITDLHGNPIKRIENNSDGRKLFTRPEYVCVDQTSETVYVSDYSRGTVTSLTLDGAVTSVYEHEELVGPQKVCADQHGNVYVCGYDSRNVHMITADSKNVKVILTQVDGLDSNVYSVNYCQDTNRLFIGMDGNKVKVYQLS